MKPLLPAKFCPEHRARVIAEIKFSDTVFGKKIVDPKEREQILETVLDELDRSKVFKNDLYTVSLKYLGTGDLGRLVHLSIKRNDGGHAIDWRDKQAIKNQLCGKEAEGMELYPAESRVLDTANQFHLWVLLDAKIPFGYTIGGKTSDSFLGSYNRPFETTDPET